MNELSKRLLERLRAGPADQQKVLRKHILALALYRGTKDDLLEEAFREVYDPAGRKVLLAIYSAIQHYAEADYYRNHSALCDADATGAVAEAQVRDARENRDRGLDSMIARLLRGVQDIEESLAKFAAGDVGWGSLAVDGLTDGMIVVAAIREMFDDSTDQDADAQGAEAEAKITGRSV